MNNSKARVFAASFVIAVICIGLVCGFLAVDLSSDRYMPGRLTPFFQVSGLGEEGIDLDWMGGEYHLDARRAQELQGMAWEYRGLLPRSFRIAGALAVRGFELLEAAVESLGPAGE